MLQKLLYKHFCALDSPFVVQIGSHDGRTDDPLYPFLSNDPAWSALLVEPLPFYVNQLYPLYSDRKNVRIVQAAVGSQCGSAPFYWVDPSARSTLHDLPSWFAQLGSLDSTHIRKHFGASIGPHILTCRVATLTLLQLLTDYNVTDFHILHVDAEGSDWIILQQLRYLPRIPEFILFEHIHLNPSTLKTAVSYLEQFYALQFVDKDCFGISHQSHS